MQDHTWLCLSNLARSSNTTEGSVRKDQSEDFCTTWGSVDADPGGETDKWPAKDTSLQLEQSMVHYSRRTTWFRVLL